MRKINLFVAIVSIATCVIARGAEPAQIDIAHELEARAFTLPTSELGTVQVTACGSCPTFRFQTTADTEYRIGTHVVRLAELRIALTADPEALVLLLLTDDRRAVREIRLSSDEAGN